MGGEKPAFSASGGPAKLVACTFLGMLIGGGGVYALMREPVPPIKPTIQPIYLHSSSLAPTPFSVPSHSNYAPTPQVAPDETVALDETPTQPSPAAAIAEPEPVPERIEPPPARLLEPAPPPTPAPTNPRPSPGPGVVPLPKPAPSPATLNPAPAPKSAAPRLDRKININTATKADLESLPGVGPVTAQAILDYRAAKGPFRTIKDLDNVKGIGPKTIERLEPHITLQ